MKPARADARGLVALTAILLSAATFAGAGQDPREPAFAVVFSDGTLTPFAVFDGRRWVAPLPRISSSVKGDPESVRTYWHRHGMQVPSQWRLVSDSGGVDGRVNVTGAYLEEHDGYGPNPIFRTDAPAISRESRSRLAYTGGDVSIRPASDVLKSSDRAGWDDVIAVVLREFPRHEAVAARRHGKAFSPSSPVRLRVVFADRQRDRRVLYFEADRDHGAPLDSDDAGCNGLTSVQGWVEANGRTTPRVLVVEAGLSDCDRMDLTTRRPLGIASIKGDEIWIMEERYYEGSSYALFSSRRGIRQLLRTWIFSF